GTDEASGTLRRQRSGSKLATSRRWQPDCGKNHSPCNHAAQPKQGNGHTKPRVCWKVRIAALPCGNTGRTRINDNSGEEWRRAWRMRRWNKRDRFDLCRRREDNAVPGVCTEHRYDDIRRGREWTRACAGTALMVMLCTLVRCLFDRLAVGADLHMAYAGRGA